MDEAKKKRGGAGRGQGRKPLSDKPSVQVLIRMPPEDRDKYQRLGGARWVRKQIKDAPEPND